MKAGSTQTLPIARSLLMNALRLEPTNHSTWSNLGSICKREGKVQQAADFFQAAYELESTAPVQSFMWQSHFQKLGVGPISRGILV